VHVVIVASYSRGQVIEQWVHAMAPSSIVYGIANNHHSPSFYSNKQYEQPEKEQEQEQASDLPALALQQVPATAACIIVQPDRKQEQQQQAASPIAKHNTTTYTIHSFQKPAVQPPSPPLRSTLSHTTTPYHRHRSSNRKAPPPPDQSDEPALRQASPHFRPLSACALSSPSPALPPSHIAALPHKLKLLLLAAHLDTIGVTSLQTRSASPAAAAAVTTAS
jgi:hypothetical protein